MSMAMSSSRMPPAVRSAGMVMPKMSRTLLPMRPKTRRMPVAMTTPRVAIAKRSLAVLSLVSAAKMKAMSATPTVANKVASATRKVFCIMPPGGNLVGDGRQGNGC
jgi:hypothetical protein